MTENEYAHFPSYEGGFRTGCDLMIERSDDDKWDHPKVVKTGRERVGYLATAIEKITCPGCLRFVRNQLLTAQKAMLGINEEALA